MPDWFFVLMYSNHYWIGVSRGSKGTDVTQSGVFSLNYRPKILFRPSADLRKMSLILVCVALYIINILSTLHFKLFSSQNAILNKKKKQVLQLVHPTFNYVRDLPTITTTHLYYIYFNTHKVSDYFRYVDCILTIYTSMHTNIDGILDEFHNVSPIL
jgi:hypothetical protein